MVKTSTACSSCIHSEVCAIKEEVCKAKNRIMDKCGDLNPCISVTVNCDKYMSGRITTARNSI